jgi:hypothetical protein
LQTEFHNDSNLGEKRESAPARQHGECICSIAATRTPANGIFAA